MAEPFGERIGQTATLLFNGWGYNFYREEDRSRADDLLIRAKAAGILNAARAALKKLENEYRREFLPPPTREQPYPNRNAVAQAQRLERCGTGIEALATAIQSAPTPAGDRIWNRHRNERQMLDLLQAIDLRLIDAAVELHDLVTDLTMTQTRAPEIETQLSDAAGPLRAIIQERRERLSLMV